MLRILSFIVCLIALAAMTGCDLLDPSETVTGKVVDAATGAPIPDALVEVGYVKPSWCEIITGKPCGPTPFEVEGSGTSGASGAFSVSYAPGPARTIRVRPCPAADPGDCPYYGSSVDLPPSGEAIIELPRHQ